MTEEIPSALGSITANNQITVVADPAHDDDAISKSIKHQMHAMRQSGVKHLFLEHDANEISIDDLRGQNNAYGDMIREAEAHGIQVHMYDDRSLTRALNQRFPDESQFVQKHDPYFSNTDALIANAPNQERMKQYVDAKRDQSDSDIERRNTFMAQSIVEQMKQYPNDKALVMVGSAHVDKRYDLDEMLRDKGYQATTVEINSPTTSTVGIRGEDKPDIILAAETGKAISYKDPQTQQMKLVMEGVELPWKNQEPVCSFNHAALGGVGRQTSPSCSGSDKSVNLER